MQVAGRQTLVTVIEQYGALASPHHDWVGVVRRKRGPKVLAPLLKRSLDLSLTRSSWCRRHLFFRVTLGTVAAGRKLAGTKRLVSAETQQHHAAIPPRLHQVSQGPLPDQGPSWLRSCRGAVFVQFVPQAQPLRIYQELDIFFAQSHDVGRFEVPQCLRHGAEVAVAVTDNS